MKILKLDAKRYRSLRDVSISLSDLNLFIGANATGKSTILDALRFLHEGVQARDFSIPVYARGGILNLPWKGEEAQRVDLTVSFEDASARYEWSVALMRDGYDFHVEERLDDNSLGPPTRLLDAKAGEGWWWSGKKGERVTLKQGPTSCALTAAAADASFKARNVAEFVSRWGFFDPSPFLLRRDWSNMDAGRFDHYGRNLGERLHRLSSSSPDILERIVTATQTILGLPLRIETREAEDRCYFVQYEDGLQFAVHQMGVSSGTLRMLALMTALHGEPQTNLIGIEEPENYVHPTALSSFVDYLLEAQSRVQFMVTTHSPLLLDCLEDPAVVRIVKRDDQGGTMVTRENNPDGVKEALDAAGFGIGEFYETKGFGS